MSIFNGNDHFSNVYPITLYTSTTHQDALDKIVRHWCFTGDNSLGGIAEPGVNAVLKIDGAYLYAFAQEMRSFNDLPNEDMKLFDFYVAIVQANKSLRELLFQSVFSATWRATHHPAAELFKSLDDNLPELGSDSDVDWERIVSKWYIGHLKGMFQKLESVLLAELRSGDIYYVSPKGGFDTRSLTEAGEELFPPTLASKVALAVPDARAASRCIAFELPSAAAFHLHRANEAVLRAYFDIVAGVQHRPRTRNLGDYLSKMEKLGVGDPKVISVLRSIKDLHRNPIMHPEDSIQSIDEALSLHAAIRAAIGYMLDRIPE